MRDLRRGPPRGGGYPIGSRIVEARLKDAEPAIASTQNAAKIRNFLRLDRQLLELYASRGRTMTAYNERKAALGLK